MYFTISPERQEKVGRLPHYMQGVKAGHLPRPDGISQSFNLGKWGDNYRRWSRWWFEEAIEYGVDKLMLGVYGEGEPGDEEEVLSIAAEYPWSQVALRPWQEGGSGISAWLFNGATTSYRNACETHLSLATGLGLPVTALISHWNTLQGIEDSIPDVDVPVYPGVSAYMPTWPRGEDGERMLFSEWIDEAHERTGLQVWVAEYGAFVDFREDPNTGWEACGWRCNDSAWSMVAPFWRAKRFNLLAGVNVMNKRIFFDGGWMDGRLDSPLTHPSVLDAIGRLVNA